jgi:type I restriction-modification system DNA methylase subunit
MNMILHGIEAPSIRHTNTLTENVMDIQERDRHDIVLANPPLGGGERREIQQNFPIKSGETAYLFLQHFIRKLRAGGRGAVVIKNTFLSNGVEKAMNKMRPVKDGVEVTRPFERVEMDEQKIDLIAILRAERAPRALQRGGA